MRQTILLIVAVALVGCASTPYTSDNPFTNTLGMKFVSVPGTKVSFCIWETRVKDYAAYAAANGGVVDGDWKDFGRGFQQADTHPVVRVSWEDAQWFCWWLTKKELEAVKIKAGQKYRLPTDAEWSVAVGLGKEKGNTPKEKHEGVNDVYPWGKELPPPKGAGNYGGSLKADNFEYTSPVGSFAANKLGLHDLGGNVWEWCEDKWTPTEKYFRVLRGASWFYNSRADYLLSSYRIALDLDAPFAVSNDSVGFRCVLVSGKTSGKNDKAFAIKKAADEAKANAFVNTLGMKFVPVPGTKVQFCIWETRVKDYAAFAATPSRFTWGPGSWRNFVEGFKQPDTHPVVNVSWNEAQAFCEWLTKKEMAAGKIKAGQKYRLPTDAEWSVAVGLGKEKGNTPKEKNEGIKGVYPWGKEWPPPKGAGNYYTGHREAIDSRDLKVDRIYYTSPVGRFSANKLGLHDMGGNVWEWCEDKWTPTDTYRVFRGASWRDSTSDWLLSSGRHHAGPDVTFRHYDHGFRCVLASGSGG